MAANIGTIKSGTYTGPGASTTVSISNVTQDSGTDRYMYLVIQHINNYTPTVKYGSDSMTKILSYSAQAVYTDVYELESPTAGSDTIELTYTAYHEYGTSIGYMVLSCTGAAGYGNIKTNTGAAGAPGLDGSLSAVGSGSAVVVATIIPTPNNDAQTITINGSSKSSDFTHDVTVGANNTGKAWFKEDVTNGTASVISQYGYAVGIITLEIKEGVSSTLPILTTTSVSSVGRKTASSGGNISSDGGDSVTARGICWDIVTNPDTGDSKTSNGTGTGSFSSSITGLSPGTTYYVRAYATNTVGTAYGNQQVFKTYRRVMVIS
jgi:hypothetical protein